MALSRQAVARQGNNLIPHVQVQRWDMSTMHACIDNSKARLVNADAPSNQNSKSERVAKGRAMNVKVRIKWPRLFAGPGRCEAFSTE